MDKWIIERYSAALWRVRNLAAGYVEHIGSHAECVAWVRNAKEMGF